MSSIEELMASKDMPAAPAAAEAIASEMESSPRFGLDFSFLMRPTGPGPIGDYLEHPLNAPRSKGLAQVLRGATGMFGQDLGLAVADIVVGGMEYIKERRVNRDANQAHTIPG